MKLKTSTGKKYEVDWVDVASLTSGHLFAQLRDDRPLHEIAEEFDGLAWLERESKEQGDKRFDGYSVLMGVNRITGDVVNVTIRKGENNG